MSLLKLDKACKFVDKKIFRFNDISLELEAGKIYGIFGQPECGSTDLIQCMVGMWGLSKGTLEFDGKLPDEAAFMPYERYFYDNYTLLDMARFYRDVYSDFDADAYNEWIHVLKLKNGELFKNMGPGSYARCAIALEMSRHAKLTAMDNPFLHFSKEAAAAIAKQIAARKFPETTLVIVTPQVERAEGIIDTAFYISEGALIHTQEKGEGVDFTEIYDKLNGTDRMAVKEGRD